jgi:flagellar assembly protein FliH
MTSSSDRFAERLRREAEQRAEMPARSPAQSPLQGAPGAAHLAARAGVYSRFIPREELNGFAAWKPGSFGDDPARKPQAAPDPAAVAREAEAAARRAAERQAAAEAQAVADRIEEIRQARDGGYHDGYRDGTVAMDAFKQSFASQTSAQVAALLQSMSGQLGAMEQTLADQVAAIALSLARQVVRSELAQRPEAVVAVAQEALGGLLMSARHVTLHLNPADEALVAQGCADLIGAREVRLVVDATIERGGCRVESDIGVTDAQVAARWQRACAAMGRELAWDGGEVAADVRGEQPVKAAVFEASREDDAVDDAQAS